MRITGMQWDADRNKLWVMQHRDDESFESAVFHRSKTGWSQQRSQAFDTRHAGVEIIESLNEPARLFADTARSGCPELLFDPNPTSARFTFGRAQVFEWTDGNRLRWEGGIVLPPDYSQGKLYPLVVQTHGFSRSEFLVDGPSGYSTAYAAQALANAGIVVLQVGENSTAMSWDAKEGVAYAEGIRAAVQKLIERGLVDREKVGVIGFSRSGWHVATLLIEYPGLIHAATLSDAGILGYVALLLSVGQPQDIARQYGHALGLQDNDASAEHWVRASPIRRLPEVHSPIRFEAMSPMSLIATWEAYATQRLAGQPADLIYFPGATHVLYRPADRLESQGGNVDWFRYWLQDYRDPDPRKVEQYTRWDKLRDMRNARLDALSESH